MIGYPPTSLAASFQVLICFAGCHPSVTVVVRTESESLVAPNCHRMCQNYTTISLTSQNKLMMVSIKVMSLFESQ